MQWECFVAFESPQKENATFQFKPYNTLHLEVRILTFGHFLTQKKVTAEKHKNTDTETAQKNVWKEALLDPPMITACQKVLVRLGASYLGGDGGEFLMRRNW